MTSEEAIVELRDLISDDRTDKENEALLMAIEALRNERPHGKWEFDSWGSYCSECGFRQLTVHRFCSECGADMRGIKNE